jgi:nitroreductase / dihydropteridine reductase
MGISCSKQEEEYYSDTYHVTDTFSNHVEWKHTVKRMNHYKILPLKEYVNDPYRFGSQPYVIYAVYHNDIKRRIQEIAHDQPNISACACIFIFCARTDFNLITTFPDVPIFEKPTIRSYFSKLWSSYKPNKVDWVTRQTYMALGFVIAACSEESIPCYPADSFHTADLASLLDLPSHIIPTALLTVGTED